ncbi:MAG: ATP-binding protein [Bacteroidales bacterium]|nr:ATP-binding protein [Bacteroidales bacterium]
MIRRIAITGPESTGKSMLTEQLAAWYHSVWVSEFARDYLSYLHRPYQESDILYMAQQQLVEEEKKARTANRFLFCDTELIVTKIWSEVKYGRCDPWILQNIDIHRYDLFLLCDIDLPWEFDPLREHPEKRKYLFDLYFNELTNRKFPFFVISGSGKARLENAIKKIDTFHFSNLF